MSKLDNKKDNISWKLDVLQFKYEKITPRYGKTKAIVKSKKPSNLKLLKLNKQQATELIKEFQLELFDRKYYGGLKKLLKLLKSVIKVELNNKKLNDNEKKLYNELNEIENLTNNSKTKIFKIVSKVFSKPQNRTLLPSSYLEEVEKVKSLKNYENNSKELNNLISKLFNRAQIKETMKQMELSFKLILGPVDKKDAKSVEDDKDESDSESESDQDSNDEVNSDDDDDEDDETDEEMDIDPESMYDQYKGMLAASSDEEDGSGLECGINYNEVTDEEPSDEESSNDGDTEDDDEVHHDKIKSEKNKFSNDAFFSEIAPENRKEKKDKKDKKERKEKLTNLPALASGYYSGGESDSELLAADKDMKIQGKERKNRRGQRARQKIWEQKYGSQAKHVLKEKERALTERESLRIAYEKRVAKRAEKAKLKEEQEKIRRERYNKNGSSQSNNRGEEGEMHPSWIAKKKQEEALKNVKFAGKKMKFD